MALAVQGTNSSQSVFWRQLASPGHLPGVHKAQTVFIIIIICYLPLLLSFSHDCTVEYTEATYLSYYKRLNAAGADLRIQPTCIKPIFKELQKCKTVPFFYFFILEVNFHKNMLQTMKISTCNEFTIVISKYMNK